MYIDILGLGVFSSFLYNNELFYIKERKNCISHLTIVVRKIAIIILHHSYVSLLCHSYVIFIVIIIIIIKSSWRYRNMYSVSSDTGGRGLSHQLQEQLEEGRWSSLYWRCWWWSPLCGVTTGSHTGNCCKRPSFSSLSSAA